jgi:hypothetical protein
VTVGHVTVGLNSYWTAVNRRFVIYPYSAKRLTGINRTKIKPTAPLFGWHNRLNFWITWFIQTRDLGQLSTDAPRHVSQLDNQSEVFPLWRSLLVYPASTQLTATLNDPLGLVLRRSHVTRPVRVRLGYNLFVCSIIKRVKTASTTSKS